MPLSQETFCAKRDSARRLPYLCDHGTYRTWNISQNLRLQESFSYIFNFRCFLFASFLQQHHGFFLNAVYLYIEWMVGEHFHQRFTGTASNYLRREGTVSWGGRQHTFPLWSPSAFMEHSEDRKKGTLLSFLRKLTIQGRVFWRRAWTEFSGMSNAHSAWHGGRKGGIHTISEGWLGRKEGREKGERGKGSGGRSEEMGRQKLLRWEKITRGFQIADLLTIETDLGLKICILYSIFMLKNGNFYETGRLCFSFLVPFSCTPHDAKLRTHSVHVCTCISPLGGEEQRAQVLSAYLCGLWLQSVWNKRRPNHCFWQIREWADVSLWREADLLHRGHSIQKDGKASESLKRPGGVRGGSSLQGLVCALRGRDPDPATP